MSTNSTTKEYRLSQWFPIVKTCRESGMTVKAWCEQHDINEKQFYYYQRLLQSELSNLDQRMTLMNWIYQVLSTEPGQALNVALYQPGIHWQPP